MSKFTVWRVDTEQIYTGSRIEGYNCSSIMFTNKKEAHDYAWNVANGFSKDGIPKKRKNSYYFEDDAYSCWGNSVKVTEVELDFSKRIIDEVKFGQ